VPVLSNPRHEKFAQELAKGVSQFEAHGRAGFKAHRSNASSLAQDNSILARVAEIQSENAAQAQKATQEAAERLSLSREWVLERLRDNAVQAADQGDFGPSNKALELIGKEIAGMFVDRKRLDIDGELRGLTDAQLIAILAGDESPEGNGETSGASRPH
jgi:phage terminase small subunit